MDSKNKTHELTPETNQLTRRVIDAIYAVHRELGPGLLECVYEICLSEELKTRNIIFERQKELPVVYAGKTLDSALRIDLLVENKVVVEIKAVETLLPIHKA